MEEINPILLYISLLLFNVVSSLSCTLLCDALLVSRVTYPQKAVSFCVMTLISCIVTQTGWLSLFPIKQVVLIVLLFCYCQACYNGHITLKSLCAIFSYSVLLIIDTAAVFLFVNIVQKPRCEIFDNMSSYVLCAAFSHAIIFSISFMTWRLLRSQKKVDCVSGTSWGTVTIFPLITIITMAILFRENVHEGSVSSLVILDIVGLLIANIALMFLLNRMEREEVVRRENALLQRELTAQNDFAQALTGLYSQQRKMTHDFKHHLSTIRYLLTQGEMSDAYSYMDNLLQSERLNSIIVSTNHPIIDAVLNQKYNAAHNSGIQMEFEVNDLSHFPLSSEEAVVVIANLLDNAIEACCKCPGEKLIRVRLQNNQYESIISIVNTTTLESALITEVPATTKRNELLHGYGLQNVCAILEKHGAIPAIDCHNGWFQFSTILS